MSVREGTLPTEIPLSELELGLQQQPNEKSPLADNEEELDGVFSSSDDDDDFISDDDDDDDGEFRLLRWLDGLNRWFANLGILLTPSFLQHLVGGSRPPEGKLHAIAALDGLRGWACLLVFNFHFLFAYTWIVGVGWGFNRSNYSPLQLPIIHMLISGHIMVSIFFVISGYVLSYKPLRTIRNGAFDETFTTLASSTFRRGLRLYIPSLVGISIVFLAVRTGAYHFSHAVISQGETIRGTNEQHPPLIRSVTEQLHDWIRTVATLLNPFTWDLYYNYYNPHLWTIPVEFRCSMVLFVLILATSRLRVPFRMLLVGGFIWFCMRYGRWDVVLFISGMLMAEVDLINGTWEAKPQPPPPPSPVLSTSSTSSRSSSPSASSPQRDNRRRRSSIKISNFTIFSFIPIPFKDKFRLYSPNWWIVMFVVGLYFGSSPNLGFKWTPGFSWLAKITPATYPEPHRFPQTIGAVLIVLSINHSRDIQKLFVNPLSQYLGKISYAFYIVHGPILHGLGYCVMSFIWGFVGKEHTFSYCFGFLLGWLFCLPIALWAADLFWRTVDLPSVSFARWVESRVIVKSPALNGQNHR